MLRFHGSRDEEGLRADRLQLAPRRGAGGDAADLPAAPRRLERRPPRGGRALRRARPRRDRRAAARTSRATSTTCTASARSSATGSPRRSREAEIGFASYYEPPLHLQPALALPRLLARATSPRPRRPRARTSACRCGPGSPRSSRPRSSASCGARRASCSDVIDQPFPVNRHRLWQLVADAVLIAAAWWLAFFLCFDQTVPLYYRHLLSWQVFALVIAIQLGVFVALRLLQPLVALRLDPRHVGRRCAASRSPASSPTSSLYAFPPAHTSHLPKRDRRARLPAAARVRRRHAPARALADRAARRAGSSRAARRCSSSAPATPASCSSARCSATASSPTRRSASSTTTRARRTSASTASACSGRPTSSARLLRDHRPDEVLIAMPSAPGDAAPQDRRGGPRARASR